MTSQAGHHGGSSQLFPNQDSVTNKAAKESVLRVSRLRFLFQVLGSISFRWLLVFLYSMAFMLASGEEQTGICQLLMDPAVIWDLSSVVNFEAIGFCPCSSTEQLRLQRIQNARIPRGHRNAANRFPDPALGPPGPAGAHHHVIKVVVTVLAIIGGIGLAGRMLYKRRSAFTEDVGCGIFHTMAVETMLASECYDYEADIDVGLLRAPAVARRSNPAFEIHPSIE